MRVTVVFILLIIFSHPSIVSGEIIVKQGSDGRIMVTNSPGVYEKSFVSPRVKYTVSSYSTTEIPSLVNSRIKTLSKKYKVPEDLIVAVARAESGFNQFAVSRKGAVGVMQLMKDTAVSYGVTNRYDLDQNLDAGVRHLKYLRDKYSNNLKLVLAAYNAGEEAVKKYKGIPPFNETRNYIKKVRRFMGLSTDDSGFSGGKTTIFKYQTRDGRIVLTDTRPAEMNRQVEIFD